MRERERGGGEDVVVPSSEFMHDHNDDSDCNNDLTVDSSLSLSVCRHNPEDPHLLSTLGLLYLEVHVYTACNVQLLAHCV